MRLTRGFRGAMSIGMLLPFRLEWRAKNGSSRPWIAMTWSTRRELIRWRWLSDCDAGWAGPISIHQGERKLDHRRTTHDRWPSKGGRSQPADSGAHRRSAAGFAVCTHARE